MWGNRLGWGISAAIAIVMVGLMYLLQSMGAHSDMTPKFAADPKNLDRLELVPAPASILTTMSDPCDAADKYREAIELYKQSPGTYKDFKPNDPEALAKLAACDLIVEAAHCKNMTLFTKDAASVIHFDQDKPAVEALRQLGEATARKALVLKASKKPDEARKYAEAAFALGAKMFDERIIYEEFDAGLGIMGAGSGVMMALAHEGGDQTRADQIQAFVDARKKFSANPSRVYDLHFITKTIDGAISGARAGDVFALAEKSKERMFRVEACLQLARTHRNVGEGGKASDQRYAQALLNKLATTDPDPVVKIAAAKARDITDVEYNRQ